MKFDDDKAMEREALKLIGVLVAAAMAMFGVGMVAGWLAWG